MRDSSKNPSSDVVTAEQLANLNIHKHLEFSEIVDPGAHWRKLDAAKMGLTKDEHAAFKLLSSICQMQFHPEDPAEPYGAMFVFEDKRSQIPNDFSAEQVAELAKAAAKIQHPGIRARIADVAWLQDRANRPMAELAVQSYEECIKLVLTGKARHEFQEKPEASHQTIELLRRAFQIFGAIKGKADFPETLTDLVEEILSTSEAKLDENVFCRILTLAQDFFIGDIASYPVKAEVASKWSNVDHHWSKSLLDVAIRGYRRNKLPDDENRCLIAKAEMSVEIAEKGAASAMFAASWFSTAISEIRLARGPDARARHEQLRLKLREAQEGIQFEMSEASVPIDLSEMADQYMSRVRGQSWGRMLGIVASIVRSEDPDELKAEARRNMAEHPLSSMMGGDIIDSEGKTVARRPSALGGDEDAAVIANVAQNMSYHRSVMVSGAWRPIRFAIQSETTINPEDFELICANSAFVPPGFEEVFALGFARFFQSDMVSAANILIPMLENSLRYVLKTTGEDTSKIEADMTQEDRSLSSLLEFSRQSLENIFGEPVIFELDLLFNSRLGPALRHDQAHGKFSIAHCFSTDVLYACWFIYHLTCLPLMSSWTKIELEINSRAAGRSSFRGTEENLGKGGPVGPEEPTE